jgi:hypothetical protein
VQPAVETWALESGLQRCTAKYNANLHNLLCYCRRQGQPLLAACAALTVNDVAGTITALHLGHEPEQAAMLCIALGQLGGVDAGLQDRVFAALGSKCEAAGGCSCSAEAADPGFLVKRTIAACPGLQQLARLSFLIARLF